MRTLHVSLVLLLAVLFLAVACAQPTPEEKLVQMRTNFTVDVNQSGFVATPREPEPALEPIDEETGEEPPAEAEGEPGADDEIVEEAPPEPTRYDILIDVLVSHTNREILPQLTVDFVHVDGSETELGRWPKTLDTSAIARGPGAQVTISLEDVAYTEGDMFRVEVRDPAPEERGQYPEFADLP